MSYFTTQVRYIVESVTNTSPYGNQEIDQTIQKACPLIFNFSYPIWDENDRVSLESLILRHYYMREIGFETVGQWKFQLANRLREIMPYYIELWKTTQKQYDYLGDIDIWETYTTHRDGESSDSSTGNSSSTTTGSTKNESSGENTSNTTLNHVSSDLPQANLNQAGTNLDYANMQSRDITDVSENASTTSTGENNSSIESSQTLNGKNTHSDTETHERHRAGKTGARSTPELIKEYRESLLQIPMEIINNLNDLFMGLWD